MKPKTGKHSKRSAAKLPKEPKKGNKQKSQWSNSSASQLRKQLDNLGLQELEVEGDGNCFFRSMSHQLHEEQDRHLEYRQRLVDFMQDKQERYEPFIEEDLKWDEYLHELGQDGTYAGHVEIQAVADMLRINICVHQAASELFLVQPCLVAGSEQNSECPSFDSVHLAYHGGHDLAHYNSIVNSDDGKPCRKVVAAAGIQQQSTDYPDGDDEDQGKDLNDEQSSDDQSLCPSELAEMTGSSVRQARQALAEAEGDSKLAIKILQDMGDERSRPGAENKSSSSKSRRSIKMSRKTARREAKQKRRSDISSGNNEEGEEESAPSQASSMLSAMTL